MLCTVDLEACASERAAILPIEDLGAGSRSHLRLACSSNILRYYSGSHVITTELVVLHCTKLYDRKVYETFRSRLYVNLGQPELTQVDKISPGFSRLFQAFPGFSRLFQAGPPPMVPENLPGFSRLFQAFPGFSRLFQATIGACWGGGVRGTPRLGITRPPQALGIVAGRAQARASDKIFPAGTRVRLTPLPNQKVREGERR